MCSRNNRNSYSLYGGYGMNTMQPQIQPMHPQMQRMQQMQQSRKQMQSMQRMQQTGQNLINISRSMVDDNGQIKNVFGTPYVFVMIKSDSCGYCQMALPEFKMLSDKLAGNKQVSLATLQADKERELYVLFSKLFGLRGVPVYLLFSNGKKIAEYMGDRTQNDMYSWLNSNI